MIKDNGFSVKIKCEIKIDSPDVILAKRHLEHGGLAMQTFQEQIYERSEPYTPKDTGRLIKTAKRDAYRGLIMYAPSGKNGYVYAYRVWNPLNSFNFQQKDGSIKRGNDWFNRMWIDHGDDIKKEVAKVIGGTAK